jgi:hypothetical protein
MPITDSAKLADTSEQLWSALEAAARYDPTLSIDRRAFPRMMRRYVAPISHSRASFFVRMLSGEPSLFNGFPTPLHGGGMHLPPANSEHAVADWLAKQRDPGRHRIFTGDSNKPRELTLSEIAAKWHAGRTTFGVTDLHIRGTVAEKIIAPDVLSQFNLLPSGGQDVQEQEMFSFVISSRGRVSDSHSDAPDSSNYCFVGKKLWLAWDTYEGAKQGLQDVERVAVYGRAHFDMESWLGLRSARWCVVNPGQALFLPAHLTHKVITLEPYIGVGGFFLALPNCVRLMSHWITRGPLWCKHELTGRRDHLLGEVAKLVRKSVIRIGRGSVAEQRRWGYDFLERSARFFINTCPRNQMRRLWQDNRFRCVADAISAPWPLRTTRDV